MKGLTAPQLCELTGFNFQRFETLRHRYRRATKILPVGRDGVFERLDVQDLIKLPVKDQNDGKWVRYDFFDALSLGVTIAVEAAGVDIKAACSLADNALTLDCLSPTEADLWVAYVRVSDGSGAHRLGDMKAISAFLADQTISAVLANVSHVSRELKKHAARMGLTVDGTRFLKFNDHE